MTCSQSASSPEAPTDHRRIANREFPEPLIGIEPMTFPLRVGDMPLQALHAVPGVPSSAGGRTSAQDVGDMVVTARRNVAALPTTE
jgi:hypothetical protein